MATWRRCCSLFALPSGSSGRSGGAHELRRSIRSASDRGAQADCGVTPRLEPPPVRLAPECWQVKAQASVREEADTRDCGQLGQVWARVLQVWVGCARSCGGPGGFTRMGCDHGLDVGHAAARSSPGGLLHPHGQSRARNAHAATWSVFTALKITLFVFLIKVCFLRKPQINSFKVKQLWNVGKTLINDASYY